MHTRPRRIRAADRVRNPGEPRSAAASSRSRNALRALKELGITVTATDSDRCKLWSLPRITETRARHGYHHPAAKADVAEVLRFFGEECVYGIRRVELRQGTPGVAGRQLGRLVVPGRIVLYDQLPSPWYLQGRMDDEETRRLEDAGAEIETLEDALVVHWPASEDGGRSALRDFMLFDVLMHEVGHHLLQHHKGKRLVRVARTRDHELFAESFARRCREVFRAGRPEDG